MDQETEVRILRKIVKGLTLKEGRLLLKNEFRRRVGDIATRLGEKPDDVFAILSAITFEVVSEMISSDKE